MPSRRSARATSTAPQTPLSATPSPLEPKNASTRPARRTRRAAVIDLGTNNCRLLIAEFVSASPRRPRQPFRVVDSFSRIVRLGEGLGQTGTLSASAVDRTLAALQICAEKIQRSGAQEVRAVATQACRQADNGPAFLAQVQAQTGIRLKTISPLQEVRLGVSSTLPLLKRRWPHALIFDVGGGSTEVSFLTFKKGHGFQLQDSLSVPLGVVLLAEQGAHTGEDLPREAYAAMRTQVAHAFASFASRNQIADRVRRNAVQTVGMSGTVTTVKALDMGLKAYRRARVDHTVFDMARLPSLRDHLLDLGTAGLRAHGCIGADRADLVLPGVAILEGLKQSFGFQRVLVLDRGLREGLLHDIFKGNLSDRPSRHRARNMSSKTDRAARIPTLTAARAR